MTEQTNSTEILNLRDAKPSDRPHLLAWASPTESELWQLAYYNNAHEVDYRDDLLQRHSNSASQFLSLDRRIDREISAMRTLCSQSAKPTVLLKNLDCLVTYLSITKAANLDLFWRKLIDLNHLESLLWIIMPPKLVPAHWAENRLKSMVHPHNSESQTNPAQPHASG